MDVETLLKQARIGAENDPERELSHWHFVQQLQAQGDPIAFQAAAQWATDPNPLVRCLSADLLGQLGYRESKLPFRLQSLPILQQLLSDPETAVVAASLVALHHLSAEAVLDDVLPLTKHESEEVRYATVFALLGVNVDSAIQALIDLSEDSSDRVRDWATFGIGTQVDADSPAIRSALLLRLTDVDGDTRDEALVGLATRGDVRALPALLDALRAGMLSGVVPQAAVDLAHPDVLAALEALQVDDAQSHSDLLAETILEVRQKLANSGG